jgi:hypothetical protein
MSRRRSAILAAALVAALFLVSTADAGGAGADVSVTVDRTRISTQLGHKTGFQSTITNRGSTPAAGLIAHLNVLSLKDGIYVDPEDWASQRTRYLGTIPAGASKTITWRIHAVNAGTLGLYVAVLDENGTARPPSTGPAIRLAVADRKTLNSGGIVPLALGVPAFLGLLTLGIRLRRRG